MNKRVLLDEDRQKLFFREANGHDGESFFNQTLKDQLEYAPIILTDYLFEIAGSECQIDCLLIYQYECVLIEVKNYTSPYVLERGEMSFLHSQKKLTKQPFAQLSRAKTMLSELFQSLGIRLKITEQLVFINSKFYLYGASPRDPVTFYGTLDNFIYLLNQKKVVLNEYHDRVVDELNSVRLLTSSYAKTLEYDYLSLKKGITCADCNGWMHVTGRKFMSCDACGTVETIEDAIVRSVRDFIFLFPEDKITISRMLEWTGREVTEYRVREVLNTHFKRVYKGKYTFYTEYDF